MVIDLNHLEIFIAKLNKFELAAPTVQIEYFMYYLTIEKRLNRTNATQIRECFLILQLVPYSNISAYLTNNTKKKNNKPPKFIKDSTGYFLHRVFQDSLRQTLKENPIKEKVSNDLRNILDKVKNESENHFLKEAVSCFEISAYRASIIMTWNLTIDHLFEYILKKELPQFNTVLVANTDKRIKITSIRSKDDFNEIPEGKFIEFCRSANIITNDVRKILETKLGVRNTYAHPSNVILNESKAIEFIEDLVNNVLLKYAL